MVCLFLPVFLSFLLPVTDHVVVTIPNHAWPPSQTYFNLYRIESDLSVLKTTAGQQAVEHLIADSNSLSTSNQPIQLLL